MWTGLWCAVGQRRLDTHATKRLSDTSVVCLKHIVDAPRRLHGACPCTHTTTTPSRVQRNPRVRLAPPRRLATHALSVGFQQATSVDDCPFTGVTYDGLYVPPLFLEKLSMHVTKNILHNNSSMPTVQVRHNACLTPVLK